ncbi:MAG: hypothetical protein QOF41_2120 [Methylobacteriaceae bacterium]|nr:hypothetical protein [Methylobacteriaceae bacterium]
MKTALAFAFGAAALLVALPASAQSHHRSYQGQRFQEQRSNEGRTVYAPQRVCVPLCNMDTSPCDPPEFKHADGRCDYPMIGR